MTTTKPRCQDCNIITTKANTKHYQFDDLCDHCAELAALENEHQDGGHDDAPVADCLLCDPNARKDRSRKGHEGVKVRPGSHKRCYAAGIHEMTKADRAACREGKYNTQPV